MSNGSNIWLLIGAGVSAGAPSNVPLWGEIAHDTMQFLYRTLEYKISDIGGDGYLLTKEALDIIENSAYPELVLECLCRAYGRTSVLMALRALLDPAECKPNACHRAIAQLCKQRRVQGIVTTNFDLLIERALDDEEIAYHVITNNKINYNETIPVIKAHGTINESSSLFFTRNEYYLGIHPDVQQMLRSKMMGTTLIIAGYSGNDMDIFPFVRSLLDNKIFSKVQVVDLAPLHKNNRFNEIKNFIEYHNKPAEEFLCRLANISPDIASLNRKKRVSALITDDDKYSAALFFGDCLLQLGYIKNNIKNLAYKIFFLTQDIVEEETGDLRQLCISKFAKSCALFDSGSNSNGESEYSAGRTMLHNLLHNSALQKQKEILSEFGSSLASLEIEESVKRRYSTSGFIGGRLTPKGPDRFDSAPRSIEFLYNVLHWELRARIRVSFAALAFAARVDCPDQQRYNMIAVAEKLMHGIEKWDTFFIDHKSADELPILPVFYSKYFRVFRSLILKSTERLWKDLDECISLSKSRGFYLGTGHCYFLKKKYGVGLLDMESEDYEAIQKYCGIDEQRMIAPLFISGREPFNLSITTYQPPIEDIKNANL